MYIFLIHKENGFVKLVWKMVSRIKEKLEILEKENGSQKRNGVKNI